MSELKQLLKARFGFETFRPGQEAIVSAALAEQAVLGVLPTGSGKTLCYQLPTSVRGGLTVVVEPLLALMDDQVARLQSEGEKRALALTSRLERGDFAWVLKHLTTYRYVFTSPETLLNPQVLAALQRSGVTLFVVDEAHCISQWGPDFRPAYLRLGNIIEQLQPSSVMALTGTAPLRVQEDIIRGLKLRSVKRVIAPFNRPNVFLGVEKIKNTAEQFDRVLALSRRIQGATIIYCATRQETVKLAQALNEKGQHAAYYHAGLDAAQRDLLYRQFMSGQIRLMCATSAFGMGIDKANVRLVIHLYVPESLEAYTQAIGRAGRDGQKSLSVLLYTEADLRRAARWAGILPTASQIESVYRAPLMTDTIDDPQLALITAYRQAGISEKVATQLLSERLGEKMASFDGMRHFLEAEGCKRAVLQAHFDAESVTHQDFCCGAVDESALAQIASGDRQVDYAVGNWKEIIKNIFNLSTKYED